MITDLCDRRPPHTTTPLTRPFSGDYKRTGVLLDRLLHRSVVINIDGDSYRMRSHRARAD
ncbi:MAG: ATP-binding protein, partial [Acidimicrobiales bacterium]